MVCLHDAGIVRATTNRPPEPLAEVFDTRWPRREQWMPPYESHGGESAVAGILSNQTPQHTVLCTEREDRRGAL